MPSTRKRKRKRKPVRVHIRWMIKRDMPEVLDIENQSFEFPWTSDDFMRCLRQRNCIGMVAEDKDEDIVGFMVYELHRHKLHVLNLAVHPKHRMRSIGRQLTEKLVSKLSLQRRTKVMTEVRERNLDAQLFFRACGFRVEPGRIIRRFYKDTDEDAYVFQYRMQSGDATYVPHNRIAGLLAQ